MELKVKVLLSHPQWVDLHVSFCTDALPHAAFPCIQVCDWCLQHTWLMTPPCWRISSQNRVNGPKLPTSWLRLASGFPRRWRAFLQEKTQNNDEFTEEKLIGSSFVLISNTPPMKQEVIRHDYPGHVCPCDQQWNVPLLQPKHHYILLLYKQQSDPEGIIKSQGHSVYVFQEMNWSKE